jgi:uncharacterized membrane protein YbhN (UPF0104 family)
MSQINFEWKKWMGAAVASFGFFLLSGLMAATVPPSPGGFGVFCVIFVFVFAIGSIAMAVIAINNWLDD